MPPSVVVRRAALVAVAAPVLLALAFTRPATAAGPGPAGAIVVAASWTAWLAAIYLLLGVVVAAATGWRHALTRALVPPALAAVVAAAVGAGGVVAADAAPATGPHPRPPAVSVDWPTGDPTRPASVVVLPGDSLWRIAARSLRRPAPARVAAVWPRWWQTNRDVIGTDPDLIHPGQRLAQPARPWRQS